ncbi:uncharacterized protein LOC134543782 isoform X1 [Bacillus rossius redtenbacheri]|uniref:uncharacterized protein LOC134543782 isoform X1 n=1 Tax=Bacillus rossius redtenbacheri TaxID=93214 RepID=UPI002FDDC5B9
MPAGCTIMNDVTQNGEEYSDILQGQSTTYPDTSGSPSIIFGNTCSAENPPATDGILLMSSTTDMSSVPGPSHGFNAGEKFQDQIPFSLPSSIQPELTTEIIMPDTEVASAEMISDENNGDPCRLSEIKLTARDIEFGLKLENNEFYSEYDFPSVNNRKFSMKWRKYKLPDGTIKDRNWLVYSKRNDFAYCLHCLLFALPNHHSNWSSGNGCQGWRTGNAQRDIEVHETYKNHLGCQIARVQWIAGKHVTSTFCEKENENIRHQREVLSVVIDCCRYFVEEMLAFRKNTAVERKLPKLFKLLAKHNPDARMYLEKIENAL